MDLSDVISLVLSILALVLSGLTAWWTIFRPPTLVTLFPQLNACSIGQDGDEPSVKVLLPLLSIRNLGARPAVITALRLKLKIGDGSTVIATPESELDIAAILENKDKYESDGRPDFPIDIDKMFIGFSLLSGEEWSERFAFRMKQDDFPKLRGAIEVEVQARVAKMIKWISLKSETMDFREVFLTDDLEDGSYHMYIFRPES